MTHLRKIAAIAYYTWLEALRARLPWLAAGLILLLLLTSILLTELALTEAARIRTGFIAAGTRIGLVVVLCLHVAHSVTREQMDRTMDLVVAQDLSRTQYYLAKLLGFIALATLYAALATLLMLREAPTCSALAWSASLALELALMVCAAMFSATACAQPVPAICFAMGFYLLARSTAALQLMAHAPIVPSVAWSARGTLALADLLAALLPDLSRFTMTAWLLDGTSGIELLYPAAQAMLYAAILVTAGVIDFRRKSI